jgi:hypothetical protein
MKDGYGERKGAGGRDLGGGEVGYSSPSLVDNYCMHSSSIGIPFQK